jgi:hypothetical protein
MRAGFGEKHCALKGEQGQPPYAFTESPRARGRNGLQPPSRQPHPPLSGKGEIGCRGSDCTQEGSDEAYFLSTCERLMLESDLLEPKKAQASR